MLRELSAGVLAAETLADFSSTPLIRPKLQEDAPAGIIKELAQSIHAAGLISDVLPFYQRVLNREFLTSSALPCGIAVPHARSSALTGLHFAFGRLPQPVPWCGKNDPEIEFVFLLAVPATEAANYLRVLRGLSRLGSTPGLMKSLRHAPDADTIRGILRQVTLDS